VQGLTLLKGEGLDGVNVLGHKEEAAADNDCDNTLNQKQPTGQKVSTQASICLHVPLPKHACGSHASQIL
jgi:hypothetical protein